MIRKLSRVDLENHTFFDESGFLNATVEIPCGCNFACKYCYRDDFVESAPFRDILGTLKKLKEMGVVNIYLTGGEIFIYPHFSELYTYLKEEGFILYLLSNGTKAHLHQALLLKYPPAKLFITIYGTSEEEYRDFTGTSNQFKEVVKTMTFLVESNISFAINANITKCNYAVVMSGKYDDFASMFGKAMSYNYLLIPSITGQDYPMDFQISEDEVIAYLKKYGMLDRRPARQETFSCNSGRRSVTVRNCDQVYACIKDTKNPFSAQMKAADLIASIKARANEIKEAAETMACASCAINSGCEWCPVEFEYGNGQQEFLCRLRHRMEKVVTIEGDCCEKR